MHQAIAVTLREVHVADLEIFFSHQCDTDACRMAAFTSPKPDDRDSFDRHWNKILANPRVTVRAIVANDEVAGHVASFEREGQRELTYWLGREHWGRGVATAAVLQFLRLEKTRPIHARVAADNKGSTRVLEKCGFVPIRTERGFANARGEEIDEQVMELAR